MTSRTVSVRDGMFSIEVAESGVGQPTLFLHGELVPPGWQAWMDDIAANCRLIAPQHPGFGRSTGLEHLDDLVDLAIFYQDLLDTLGLDSIDLIGESFGAMVAAEVAALAPWRIRRLALVAPHGLWLDEDPTLDIFGLPADELHRASWSDPDGPIARQYAPDASKDEEEWRRQLIERARSLAAAGKFMWPIADKGLRKRIHRISSPTLLLWGANDRIVPMAYGNFFHQKIRTSELVLIPDAGHLPLLEQPAEALRALQRFLRG